MPMHDWSRIPSGLFHHFHQDWSIEITRLLNRGRLPAGLSALVEQRAGPKEIYASRANLIVVRHRLGRIVAVIEIVSPGNKDSKAALRDFVDKTIDFLRKGIHVLIIDLFPPTPRDPFGLHKVIWDEITEEDFALPKDKNRVLVSYETGAERAAYIETVGVGDNLPDMPLILTNSLHVMVPLESTYQATWEASPEAYRQAVETGVMPDPDVDEDG
jgi:hypothetical protein